MAPGQPAPEAYRRCSGRWWGEGFEYVFSWHDGALRARGADAPAGRPPAVFAPLPDRPDVLRTVSGREAGELLRLTRDAHGTVVRMHWATYRFTRHQETFDAVRLPGRLLTHARADGPGTGGRPVRSPRALPVRTRGNGQGVTAVGKIRWQ